MRQLFRPNGLALASLLFLVTGAGAQDPPPRGSREAMWPAPTAEDWKRPCLITWQRSFEDAVAVSKETQKPILIAVNMDGEIASEHYAGIRYRQPDIAALYEPYVCVIASVYRHTPRDYDEEGRRVLCPRFGSVTCGEHIWIEPGLFETVLRGRARGPAPHRRRARLDGDVRRLLRLRHRVGVRHLARGHREARDPARTIVRGDRTIVERVGSPDIEDRRAVEASVRRG